MARPSVSLIIPTYDRPAALRTSLRAVANLEYPSGRWEVIVVDDGSPELVEEVVSPFRDRRALTLVRQSNQGPAAARNAGARCAGGTLLAFTDDDCRPSPSWLCRLVDAHQSNPGSMVGGQTVNALPENPYSTVSELLVDFLRERHQSQAQWESFFASNNLLVPADRFRETGGFDNRFPLAAGEDRDFCLRWAKRGWATAFATDAVVHHAHSLTFHQFLRQHCTYGRGAFHVHRKHTSGQSTQRSLSFYRDLMAYPLDQHPTLNGARYVVLMGLAQGATAAGYAAEAIRHRDPFIVDAGCSNGQHTERAGRQ